MAISSKERWVQDNSSAQAHFRIFCIPSAVAGPADSHLLNSRNAPIGLIRSQRQNVLPIVVVFGASVGVCVTPVGRLMIRCVFCPLTSRPAPGCSLRSVRWCLGDGAGRVSRRRSHGGGKQYRRRRRGLLTALPGELYGTPAHRPDDPISAQLDTA